MLSVYRQPLEEVSFQERPPVRFVWLNDPMFRQKPLCVQCGHTARSCSSHCLAVYFVLGVSAGKNAFNVCVAGTWLGDQVAYLVHIQPAVENIRIGLMPNRNE